MTDSKTTFEDIAKSRHIFTSQDEAATFAEQAVGLAPEGLPIVSFDNDWPENHDVIVKVLKTKVGDKQIPKALIVWPMPRIDEILKTEAGQAWVANILHKELDHVLVRPLRDAENVEAMKGELPITIDSFITTQRGAGSRLLQAFTDLQSNIITVLKKNAPWNSHAWRKADLRKAMENSGYASYAFPELEENGKIVEIIQTFIRLAQTKDLDCTLFNTWIDSRNEQQYDPGEVGADVSLSDLDLEDFGIEEDDEDESDSTE